MRNIRIATVSFEIPEQLETVRQHLDRAKEYIKRASQRGAHIICLPETVTTYHTTEGLKPEDYPGEWTTFFQEVAREFNIAIVAPYLVREGNIQFNQATIIDAGGEIVGEYRKIQPTGREADAITPGNELPIFDLKFSIESKSVKIAVMICMDIYFPEIPRIYAMKGAEVLFWPTMTHGPTQAGLEAQARVRAMDNSLILVEANYGHVPPYAPYAGRFLPSTGRIIDHNGDVIATTGRRPGIVIADVDLDEERRTLDCFLIDEVDTTRNDIERLARMEIFAREYGAIAKKQQRYYETINRTK